MSEEKVVHCSMDTLDTYVYQLKINNAISACDDVLRVFVVQDFSTNNLSLKVNAKLFYKKVSALVLYRLTSTVLCQDQLVISRIELTGFIHVLAMMILQN